jgi:acylphosphatase
MKRVHLIARGRVQGVYFRASTRDRARQLSLRGWVQNCPDGSVETLAEGEQTCLEQFVTWCQKGPPGAIVADLDVEWQEATGEFAEFRIRY